MTPLVDLLLREPTALDDAFATAPGAAGVLPRLVYVSMGSLLAYAAVMGLLTLPTAPSFDVPLRVLYAYGGGFFGAQVAALPSAWFYALLAGIRQPAWRVAAEAMRAHATTSMVLLGVLPVYLAAALGAAVLDPFDDGPAHLLYLLGFSVPFVAGLAGTFAMYRAFGRLVQQTRQDPDAPRTPTPALLVLAWSALFTTMAPLGVYCLYA